MASHGKSLQLGIDRQMYQVVTKYLEDHDGSLPKSTGRHAIYDWIRNSNSSLSRRPKRQLEDSIQRVLAVIQEDENKSDSLASLDGEFGAVKVNVEKPTVDLMNRNITSAWPSNTTTVATMTLKEREKRKASLTKEGAAKKKKSSSLATSSRVAPLPPSNYPKLCHVGGLDAAIEQLEDQLVFSLLRPQDYIDLGLSIPRGILLFGPPGCGKTMMCRAFANDIGVPFIEMQAPSIVSSLSGESEKQIREIFQSAKEAAPSIVFIDEIDVIGLKRANAQGQMEKRVAAQLMLSMDGLEMEENDSKPVIVLAATNDPDALDPALRRGGRFGTEINIGIPDESAREAILQTITQKTNLSKDVDFKALAKATVGFVGADLRDLCTKAGSRAMKQSHRALKKQIMETDTDMETDSSASNRSTTTRLAERLRDENSRPMLEGLQKLAITMADFSAVLPTAVPSTKREGFVTRPDLTWDDVEISETIRSELQHAIIDKIKDATRYEALGISRAAGVLLWGPPGCGKTLLAKVVAGESGIGFLAVRGSQLMSKYVGDSERAIRQLFTRARSCTPCIIYFDELDALVPHRNSEDQSEAAYRVVTTLLTEVDGLDSREGLYLMASTNRPHAIDSAMLRSGRLDTSLYVGLPAPEQRANILRAMLLKTKVHNAGLADFAAGDDCRDFSGADLRSLMDRALRNCLVEKSKVLDISHLKSACSWVRSTVTKAKD